MHARLKRRWQGLPVPITVGGWYPVREEESSGQSVWLTVDGKKLCLTESELELTEQPRRTAVLACDVASGALIAVCPAGHHVPNPSVLQPQQRCEKCGRSYEIDAA